MPLFRVEIRFFFKHLDTALRNPTPTPETQKLQTQTPHTSKTPQNWAGECNRW